MRSKLSKKVQEEVRQAYAVIAAEFDQTRKRPWEEFHHFLAYVQRGSRVLDLGCGNGRLFEFLKEKNIDYFGVDNNSEFLVHARKNYPNGKFELADMIDLNLEEGAFNNIFCIAAFHHLPGRAARRKAVDQMHRVLKEDGVLILTVWNLFQIRYVKNSMKAIASSFLHLGFKYAWNDLWIKWGGHPKKRYYHSFLPGEIKGYFSSKKWKIEEMYFTRKGNRVPFYRCFNIVIVVRKK